MLNLIQQLISELKALPFTMVTVLGLVGFAVYAYQTHASAAEIGELAKKVDQNTTSIEKVLVLQIADNLRSLQAQRCAANGDNERTLSRTIEELQSDYRRLTGSRYPLRECTT